MDIAGLVLIADDDQSFLQAVVEACRDAGHECDTATSVDETLELLPQKPYELVVASLELPGNFRLRIVHAVRSLMPGLPILVTTSAPTLDTAVEAVELPVVAYLSKPVNPHLLVQRISQILQNRPGYRTLSRVIEALHQSVGHLEGLRAEGTWREGRGVPAVTLRALTGCIVELLNLGGPAGDGRAADNLCAMIGCPYWPQHEAMFREVIRVLQETKRRFKSKELAELRDQLDRHLGIWEK